MKRIVSLFLSLAMVLSMVPAQVFATGTEPETETTPVVETTAPVPEETTIPTTDAAEEETTAPATEETTVPTEETTEVTIPETTVETEADTTEQESMETTPVEAENGSIISDPATGGMNDVFDYELENNNRKEDANFIADGTTMMGELTGMEVNGIGDIDYFRFTLHTDTEARITIISARSALIVDLCDAQDECLVVATPMTQTTMGNWRCDIRGTLPAGDYYLSMMASDGYTNSYKIYLETDDCKHTDYSSVTINPTCTKSGYTINLCKNCRYEWESDFRFALGHDASTRVTEPTCYKQGYTTYTCKRCDETWVGDYTPESHEYEDGICSLCNMLHYISGSIDEAVEIHYGNTYRTVMEITGQYAKITLPESGILTIYAYVNSDAEYEQNEVLICDADGDPINGTGFVTSNGAISHRNFRTGLDAGTYYIRFQTSHSWNAFKFDVSFQPTQYCELEGTRTELTQGRRYYGYYGTAEIYDTAFRDDEDGYMFYATAGTTYQLAVGNLNTLYNSFNAAIDISGAYTKLWRLDSGSAANSGYWRHYLNFTPRTTGWCYIDVRGVSYYDYQIGYDIMVSDTSACAHRYSSVTKSPNCTEGGSTTYTCDNCGETYEDELTPPKGHNWSAYSTQLEATCTTDGLKTATCSRCQETGSEVIPATGHTEEVDAAKEVTCTETGLTEGKHCSVCDTVLLAQEIIPANGHTEVIDEALAPTCTETGLTEGKHCSVCQEVLIAQEVIPAIAHSFVDGFCDGCGEQEMVWFASDDGILTIFAKYGIPNFASAEETPWYELRESITAVIVEDGTTRIGSYAFADLSGLTAVFLPDSVTSIGESAFYGCKNMDTLSFPASARVEADAFRFCARLTSVTITAGTGSMCDYDDDTCLYLPWNQTSQVVVKVSNGVKSIGDYAFYGAGSVQSVQLPDTLTSIGDYAFADCPIPSVTLCDGITAIGAYALSEMDNLTSIVIPDTVAELGSYALAKSKVRAVELSDHLKSIPEGLFYNCGLLDTVVIPDGITLIEKDAFYGCKALYGISIPEGVTELGEGAFRSSGLNNIKLPDSLTTIGEYAFAFNDHLTKMTIPSGVRSIGQFAFAWCEWLDTLIVYSWDLTIEANAFFDCTSCHTVYFSGNSRLWNVAEGETGVHIVYTPGAASGGNSCLIYADVYSASQYTPVQEVHILDVDGLFGPAGGALDGGIVYVDLNKVKSIKLRYQVLPADADYPEITWTSDEWDMTDAKVDKKGDLILSNMQPGEMTVFAQNFSTEQIEALGSDPYTYTTASVRFVFRRLVTSISISGDHDGYAALDTPITLTAKVLPENADSASVNWSVENITGKAMIDQYGRFTGTRCGVVIVRAEAADGSGIVAEKTIAISEYAVQLSGPAQVASGKSITLSAKLVPFNMTKTTIRWKLKEDADSAFVTLSGGKLTARKNLTEKREVTVVAYTADGQAKAAEVTVLVVPLTSAVTISLDGEPVAGQTVIYDLNDPQLTEMKFSALTLPGDADDGIAWTCSYAGSSVRGNEITIANVDGKTDTITVTAAATDGSGKKASVKVQFVRLAQSVEILDTPVKLRGGSKLTLQTDVAADKSLTDKNILWSLSDDSLPYASISAKGVLTTRTVSVPVTITVCAQVKANPEILDEIQIQLVPGAVEPQISLGERALTKGETIYVDMATPTVILTGSTLPASAIQSGSWKCSGSAVAELVDNKDGTVTVTMKKPGSTTITFTTEDGSKKSTNIKIQAVLPVNTIGLYTKDDQHELRSGKSLQISTRPYTAQAGVAPTVKNFSWSVSDPTAATVSSTGKVKALTVYENTLVTVTATAMDGSGTKETYDILIKPAKEETLLIRLGEENITGTSRLLHAVFDGSSTLPREQLRVLVYNSETETLTPVDAEIKVSGKSLHLDGDAVSPKAYGTSAVTVKYGKLSAKVSYQVVRNVEGITVTSKTGAAWVLSGKSLQLTAAVTNKDATIKKLAWSVDDPSVATVSASGKLTAKTVYTRTTVTVTASATDGSSVKETFPVTIYPETTGITIKNAGDGMVLNNRTITVSLTESRTMTLEAIVYPTGEAGALSKVTFSGGSKAAKVNPDGTIEFLKTGTVTVKVTAGDGSKVTASFQITIKA